MNVLLIQDVDNLGYAGEVKRVADGFGRNYLLPQKMAVLATPGALKQAETIRKTAEKQRAQAMADAQAIANQLADVELLFERRAGETGKLYGSVTSSDVAEAIESETGIAIDRRKVALAEPIRSLGEQMVPIKLMIDVTATVKVQVLPLGGILERERLTQAEEDQLEAEAAGETVTAAEPEPSSAAAPPGDEPAEAEAPPGDEPAEAEAPPGDEPAEAEAPPGDEPAEAEAPPAESAAGAEPVEAEGPPDEEMPQMEAPPAEGSAEAEVEPEAEEAGEEKTE